MVERIQELAKRKGLSLTGLEKETGVHNIYRWDTHMPSADKLMKVADYLGVSVDCVLGREPIPEEHEPEQDSFEEIRDELEALRADPDLRVLLSAGAGLTREDLEMVIAMAKRMKGEN